MESTYKLLLYCSEKYENQAKNLTNLARGIFDEVICYQEKYIKQSPFYKENIEILSQSRGAGYWLWKPYIILDSFDILRPNDKVLYMDCGDIFNSNIIDGLDTVLEDTDICLTSGSHQNKVYTKRDCFELMGCDGPEYWDSLQVEAGVIAFRPSLRSQSIFEEWLEFCKNPNILTDTPNICGLPNLKEFKDHRHDQSVLSNLSVKYGIKKSNYIRKSVNCNKND